jgi:beta-barrel assembly-enhancing protease
VQSGLILAIDNEAQLVAALSHESAHIAERHFTRLVTQQRVWKWSLLIAGGPLGYLLNRKTTPIVLARSLRRSELEADLLGLQYQYASGYDPTEFINLIRNLSDEQEKPSVVERVNESHPPAAVRIHRAQVCIGKYLPARAEAVVDTSQFQEFKTRVTAFIDWNR